MDIEDAFNRLCIKRKSEFELLWIKYEKISKSIQNLQHKENFRLNHLEGKENLFGILRLTWLENCVALKPKEKKSKIKENIDILTARQTSTNGGLARINIEAIQDNIERFDLTSRGA